MATASWSTFEVTMRHSATTGCTEAPVIVASEYPHSTFKGSSHSGGCVSCDLRSWWEEFGCVSTVSLFRIDQLRKGPVSIVEKQPMHQRRNFLQIFCHRLFNFVDLSKSENFNQEKVRYDKKSDMVIAIGDKYKFFVLYETLITWGSNSIPYAYIWSEGPCWG